MKHIIIAVVTIMLIAGNEMAHAGGLSGLMATVEESMPVIERLANATDDDLRVHCMGDEECIKGMRNDVKHLNTALNMLNNQRANYKANQETVQLNEKMMGLE